MRFRKNGQALLKCPGCGSVRLVDEGSRWSYTTYRCRECGCRFVVDLQEHAESREPIYFDDTVRILNEGKGGLSERLRLYLSEVRPEWRKVLRNGEITGFVARLYRYVDWNNNGNSPGIGECIEYGIFESDVSDILGDGSSVQDLFDDEYYCSPEPFAPRDLLYAEYKMLKAKYSSFCNDGLKRHT